MVEEASLVRDIEPPDVPAAGKLLASAFRGYPFFEYCLGNADNYERMGAADARKLRAGDHALWESVDDNRSERSCAATAAGD